MGFKTKAKALLCLGMSGIFLTGFNANASDDYVYGSELEQGYKVKYHMLSDEYEVGTTFPGARYKRVNYQRMLNIESIVINKDKRNDFKNKIVLHAHKIQGVDLNYEREARESVSISHSDKNISSQTQTLSDDLKTMALKKSNKILAAVNGFLPLGELISFKAEIENENDNGYNGIFAFMGLSEYGVGLEGDDRGDTFSLKGQVEIEFEKSKIVLRRKSKMYGRFAQENDDAVSEAKLKTLKGFRAKAYHNKDGEVMLEALTIDDIELEFKKFPGDDNYYVRVIGRYKQMQDQSGLAQKVQNYYHRMIKKNYWDNIIVYDYRDHFEDKSGIEGELEYGHVFPLYQEGHLNLDAIAKGGVNFSSIADTESYAMIGAEMTLRYSKNPTNKMSGARLSLHHKEKFYFDGEKGSRSGIEISYGHDFKNCTIYTNYEIQFNDDRYENEYGVEELSRNGHLDANHVFALGANCLL